MLNYLLLTIMNYLSSSEGDNLKNITINIDLNIWWVSLSCIYPFWSSRCPIFGQWGLPRPLPLLSEPSDSFVSCPCPAWLLLHSTLSALSLSMGHSWEGALERSPGKSVLEVHGAQPPPAPWSSPWSPWGAPAMVAAETPSLPAVHPLLELSGTLWSKSLGCVGFSIRCSCIGTAGYFVI